MQRRMDQPRQAELASGVGGRSGCVPALDYDRLTPAYDTLLRIAMPEKAFKRRLLDAARLYPGCAVLDVGCGTGTLAIMAK